MIRFLYIIFSCFLANTLFAASVSNDSLLKQLDATIQKRSQYRDEKENQIKLLKNKFAEASTAEARFELCSQLYDAYLAYQTDSAFKYINIKKELLSQLPDNKYKYNTQLNYVGFMTVTGMYKEGLDILLGIPRKEIPNDLVRQYFHHNRTLYGRMADYALTEEEKNKYLLYTDNYRDSLLSVIPPTEIIYKVILADKLNYHEQYDDAIKVLKGPTDSCKDVSEMRFLAYTISESYLGNEDIENQERYLILSAISDLRSSTKEYISLSKLALLLYKKGDIDRAYEYMKCSLEDGLSCNARSRTIEVAEIFPVIDKAYQIKSLRIERTVQALLGGISLLALCLIGAIIYVYRQLRKLAAARQALAEVNKQLQEMNGKLTDTNKIKEEYIAQYINRCSVYIDKIDNYRRKLAKLASASKLEELYKTIKSDSFIDEERTEFYNEFDHTFLVLFPHFVEDFNNLLNEKDRISLKNGELLNTELRIFALIRLGITDSTRIAEFLQYSVTTIYNYRSKIRNKAKGDKNEFENQVMKIG